MLLSKSFNRKQTDPHSSETLREKDNESLLRTNHLSEQKSEKFARQSNANIVHSLQDAKTKIPSVTLPSTHTKPKTFTTTHLKDQKVSHIEDKKVSRTIEQEKKDKIKDEIKDEIKGEIKNDKSDLNANETCNPINCTKEKFQKVHSDANGTCNSVIYTKNRYKEVDLDTNRICVCSEDPIETSSQHDSEDKICPMKLTEIINNSVKEAMQSIVEQRKTKEERDVDKKRKEEAELDKACYVDKEGVLAKMWKREHRPRTIHCQNSSIIEQLRENNEGNRNRLRERYNSARANFGNSKRQNERRNAFEETKRKRHSRSSNNVKTDNRRMTGNVNIYICSEASENIRGIRKQDESQSCVGSSSETTTEQSKVSSNKLVTCIRNRHRRSKEQNSFDLLPKSEENKDDSTVCSSGAYEDSRSAIKLESCNILDIYDKDVRAENGSTLIEYECKDTEDTLAAIDKSDLSFRKSKLVEEPCSTADTTKSSSNSGSGGWSSKSICSSRNTDHASSDTWSMEPNLSCRPEDNEIRRWSLKTRENVCIDRSGIWCNCKNRRSFFKTVEKESWMTCNCITEEEEDVCVDNTCQTFEKPPVEEKETATVCCKTSEDLKETAKFVPCTRESTEKLKEDTKILEKEKVEEEKLPTVAEKEEEELKEIVFVSSRTVRPEVTLLKQLLKQPIQTKPVKIIDQKDIPPPSIKKAELPEPLTEDAIPLKPEIQVSPRILEKYRLPKRLQLPSKFVPKEPTIEKKRTPKKVEIVEEKLKEKALEKKENDISKDTKTMFEKTLEEKDNDKMKDMKTMIEEEKNSGTDTKVQEILKPTFLFKGLKKITDKTKRPDSIPEGFKERKNGIVEPSPPLPDIDTDKIVDIPETETSESPEKLTNETKEVHELKEKWIPSKLYEYIPNKIPISIPKKIRMPMLKKILILGKKYESEPRAINSTKPPVNGDSSKNKKNSSVNNPTKSLTNEENKKNNKNNPTFNPSRPIKEEINKNMKDKINPNSNKENPDTNKSLLVTNSKNSPTQNTDTELGSHENSKDDRKISEARENIENREFHESLTKPQFEKKLDVQREETPELQITKAQEEKPTKMVHVNVQSENELLSTQLAELESQTICTNHLGDYATTEKSTCNCCYLHRSNNEPVNYPKSCLKRERQCCHTISQESNRTIPYHGKRNWEECGCRRTILCKNCHRPRNECSCRLTVDCVNCYKSRNKCNCQLICERKSSNGCVKSMFCLYCDNPRDKCTCRAPVKKCSYCELSVDLCVCKDQKTICDGRPVPTEPDNDRTMYVTAWKPREEVRRYFSRNLADLKTDSIRECCHCEKLKQHNSDDLPYQRLSVFSDVMDELQQKIIKSTCCARCKKIPCCCNITVERDERKEDRKIKYYISIKKCSKSSLIKLSKGQSRKDIPDIFYQDIICCSPKTRRKIIAVCVEKANDNCKYESNHAKSDKQKKIIVALCCVCKATPCRCKRSKSSQKKLKAKCYYCKNSPCICIAARERNKSRPCRCTDSPCRTKEKESTPCGKTSTKPKNNDDRTICVH